MAASPSRAVEPLGEHATDEFFRYLDDHLRDNGDDGTGYFMPLPRDESRFPPEKVESFRAGLRTEVGRPGWRRAWIARDPGGGRIVGHVDLRAHVDRFAEHRCLLGMGVDRDHRRSGLGHTLLAHATAWATTTGCLEWIDLQVLSANEAAIRLYRRAGFLETGEVPDMFRLDGQRFSYLSMSLPLPSGAKPDAFSPCS